MDTLRLTHGSIQLPEFLPDATKGVVRSVDSTDLENCTIQALVMNTFHLMQNPGTSTIHALGGLHQFANWKRPIITDSGGFQIYSLIRQNHKQGSLTDRGAIFRIVDSSRKYILTPEKSIQLQIGFGSDVVFCLDDCTHADDPYAAQEISVRRTIDWAKRSKVEYLHLLDQKNISRDKRPLIFAVIQGGASLELRKRCADELIDIGFDGFGYGGWPLDNEGNLLEGLLSYTREMIPVDFPMHALGVAHPAYIIKSVRMGYDLFDGALPTRDARHGRLYGFTTYEQSSEPEPNWFRYVYILDDRYIKSKRPISTFCDCHTCAHYCAGYLHHLFKTNDSLAIRLATIHNLRFMTQLTEQMRKNRHV